MLRVYLEMRLLAIVFIASPPGDCIDCGLCRLIVGRRATKDALCLKLDDALLRCSIERVFGMFLDTFLFFFFAKQGKRIQNKVSLQLYVGRRVNTADTNKEEECRQQRTHQNYDFSRISFSNSRSCFIKTVNYFETPLSRRLSFYICRYFERLMKRTDIIKILHKLWGMRVCVVYVQTTFLLRFHCKFSSRKSTQPHIIFNFV